MAGRFNIGVFAFSNDPNVDPEFKACQDTCEVQIVRDSPIINEPIMSPIYYSSGLDHQTMYVYPGKEIEIRCNVTCFTDIENVGLYYSVDSGEVWNRCFMSKKLENEWVGTIPRQSEGKLIVFYVEALSSTEKSSRTIEYRCRVLDLQVLELKTKIVTIATTTIILVGCLVIFALKRRRMTEIF